MDTWIRTPVPYLRQIRNLRVPYIDYMRAVGDVKCGKHPAFLLHHERHVDEHPADQHPLKLGNVIRDRLLDALQRVPRV